MTKFSFSTCEPEVRFWMQVKSGCECWEWIGVQDSHGYGYITINGRQLITSRYSWILHYGQIESKDVFVLHKCDNRLCVRPDHLFLGSARDNTADMIVKGRTPKRWLQKRVKPLSDEEIGNIRWLHSLGLNQRVIATQFSINQSTVSLIIRRKLHKHV